VTPAQSTLLGVVMLRNGECCRHKTCLTLLYRGHKPRDSVLPSTPVGLGGASNSGRQLRYALAQPATACKRLSVLPKCLGLVKSGLCPPELHVTWSRDLCVCVRGCVLCVLFQGEGGPRTRTLDAYVVKDSEPQTDMPYRDFNLESNRFGMLTVTF
jgi:hypothetical protein